MVFGKGKTFEVKQPDETALDADGFVGVDPIYQNFANDTDEPLEGSDEDVSEKDESAKTEHKTTKTTKPVEPAL